MLASSCLAAEITGTARVVDGDTIYLDTTKIRFHGVDAPETDQVCLDANGEIWTCGITVRDRLVTKIDNQKVTCETSGLDRFGRSIASCKLGAEDLERWLVKEGLALAYVKYSQVYTEDERMAEKAHAGLWAGAFVAPWDWRQRNAKTFVHTAIAVSASARRLLVGGDIATPLVSECTIKGNVNRKGERIYHVPGQRYYAQTKMEKGSGERWFCSEDEAQAAGWRRSAL